MKLASLKGGDDGRLVVVSNDLAWFTDAGTVAPTLQAALDDWGRCGALLQGLEVIPRRAIPYRSVVLEEMDLDAILARQQPVKDDGIERAVSQAGLGVDARGDRDHLVALVFQATLQAFQELAFVFDNEETDHGSPP